MDTDASGLIAQAQTPGTTTTNSLRASLSPMTLPIRVDSRTPRERRAGLSCAECRRSKLKCDRAIPCQACQRRGCAAICPDGTMAATKGNKALQNRAQKLEEQVSVMSDKIKELEAALASTTRTQSHSELRSPDNTAPENPDHDLPKRETEENSAGRLGIDKEGFARYYGGSCASEHLIHLLPGTNHQNMHYCPNMQELGLSLEVVQLYDAFPFGLRERPYSKDLLLPYLPPYERAVDAVEYYMRTFGWIIASHDDISTVIDDIYRHSPTTVESVHPHRLALLFGILSLASLHNMNPNLSEINATRYYVLACSAISLVPILSEASCATIQGIFACHVFLSSRIREASEENWLLLGIMARLAQSIGLHRDGSQFDLDAAEVQRRRITFWELYSWDAWTALTTGRPPAMSLADISSKIPCDGLDIFHTWRFNFAAECLWPALRITLGTTASYDATMQMDQKVRAFPVPPQLQPHVDGAEVHPWPIDIACAMRRCLVINFKELTLLSLHRNYFALALTGEHANPLEHKFRGSVLAAYHTATCLSGSLRDLYSTHPTFVRKLWYFWSAMFSACIILAAVPIFRPNCTLARGALLELRAACGLFVEGTQNHCFSGATYILERLRQRAEWSLDTYWNDPLTHRGAYLRPGEVDELRILGGLETTIHYSYPRYSQSPPPYLPQVSDIRAQASIGSVRPSGVRLQQPRRPHNEPISSYQHILSGSYRSSPRNEFVRAANGGVALPCTISNNMNKGITVTGLLSSRSGPSVGLQLDPQPMDRSSVSRSESYTESVDNMVWRSFMESLVDQGSLQSLHPFPI